ncbi:hypothetical protein [Kalamiella sp. sgz302252]|uniref:hypothetical protein n=1 Tax=Pantoea sp. sgz302252 TaxID=3341827 RepID=UPI0036D2486C
MCYKRKTATPDTKIDYDAIRAQKNAMLKQFLQARKEAEQAGKITRKPFIQETF